MSIIVGTPRPLIKEAGGKGLPKIESLGGTKNFAKKGE